MSSRVPSRSRARQAPVDINPHWWDHVDWWNDPHLAYARGLVDGYAAGRADKDAIDDQVHREAVQAVLRIINTVDARRETDRGDSSEGQQAA